MDKIKVHIQLMESLYHAPYLQVIAAMNNLIHQNALAQNKPPNKIYGVVYKGINFFSKDTTTTEDFNLWDTEWIEVLEQYESEFEEFFQLLIKINDERQIIGSYLTHILNNSHSPTDVFYLLNHQLHQYLPRHFVNTDNLASLDAQDHAKYVAVHRPGRDSIINERILTNILIKNL